MENYLSSTPKSKKLFKSIHEVFDAHNISPTPINYLVWYEYFLHPNSNFTKEIDKALSNGGKWHDILGFRLYHGFIKQQCTDIHEFEDDLVQANQMMNMTLQGMQDNIAQHEKLIDKGATADELAKLKSNHQKITESHQRTQSLLNGINEKAQQTISFNLKDPITKLYNLTKLDMDIEKLRPLGSLPPVLVFEMDHFHRMQIDLGALVSENLVRFVARAMIKHAGRQHTFRGSNDTFLIFMPEGEEKLKLVGENIRKIISEAKLKRKDTGESVGNFTLTGIIFYPSTYDFKDSLATAINTLHIHKGRNQRNAIHLL